MIKNVPKSETVQQAAERLCKKEIKGGYKFEAAHPYTDINENILFWRIRLKHPNGDKHIRPMHMNAKNEYQLGEPPEINANSKPLYGLSALIQNPSAGAYIVEGELVVDELNAFFIRHDAPFIAITSGGATSADYADWKPLSGRNCILWSDNDEPGLTYINNVKDKIQSIAASTTLIDINLLNLPDKGDFIDWLKINSEANLNNLLCLPLKEEISILEEKTVAIPLNQFLGMELPPREYILSPWLPKAGLCMIYAARGVGKTYLALEILMAIAYGDTILSFSAPKPMRVLYIDGEMPANTMQERLAEIEKRKSPNSDMIQPIFITPDLQPGFMPNLSTLEGQEAIHDYVKNSDLVIVDNVSTLCHGGKENEAESWWAIQEWALKLRRRGISVLFIHHAGKNGSQRGTSKREDILDTVIKLKHPSDYEFNMGACFELHFEKARGLMGDNAIPIRCQLTEQGWVYEALEISNYQKVIDLYNDGFEQHEIVKELGLSKSQVSKHITKAKKIGDCRRG